jgi:hypothetical protein
VGQENGLEVHSIVAMSRAATNNETRRHVMLVAEYIGRMIKELIQRQEDHDKSKLDSPEIEILTEVTPELRKCTYGSDEYKSYLEKMKPMLEHHYQVNRHHPEHYAGGIKEMNLVDIVEMICDWKAASRRQKNGDIYKSLDMNQQRYGYSDELKQILKNTVDEIDRLAPPKEIKCQNLSMK